MCYTVELGINEITIHDFTYTQKLVCHISFLGDFFCIYGRDDVQILQKEKQLIFDPVLTISPIDIYNDCYVYLRQKIKDSFPNYRLVPYHLIRKRINELNFYHLN